MAIDASSSSVVGYDAVLHDAHWEFKTNKRWTRMDEQANNFVEQQWHHFKSSSENKIGKARFTLSPSVWGDYRIHWSHRRCTVVPKSSMLRRSAAQYGTVV